MMIKRIFDFQKEVTTKAQMNFFNTYAVWCFILFLILISPPVAFVVEITLMEYIIFHEKDALYHKVSPRFGALNLYLNGYFLFFLVFGFLWLMMLCIGLPIQYMLEGNFNGVVEGMFQVSAKNALEMIFCLCLYQISIFYMLVTKREKGITNFDKKKEFLVILVGMGIVFFFTRSYILKDLFLQDIVYVILCISIFVLPFITLLIRKKPMIE